MTLDSADPGYSWLRAYVNAFRRRKWWVLLAVVLTPAVAVAYSLKQPKRYEATAKVLLSRQNLASTLSGTASADVFQDPSRFAQTQVDIARVPTLAERVVRANSLTGTTAHSFLERSHVSAESNADVLDFQVEAASAARARLLATSYATEFTRYRRQLDAAAFNRAERHIRRRLEELKASGEKGSPLYASLAEKDEQLRTLSLLGTSNAALLRVADHASQVQPRPVRNGVLAGLLGLLLGVVVAGVVEALDTRTRSSDEISAMLGVPLIGRVPETALTRRRKAAPAIVRAPSSAEAEAFRMIRANLDVALRNTDRRTIMVTSALGLEGKTTTLANLAVALAIAGRHVIAVDLDLRRSSLGRLLGVPDSPGVSDVALGTVTLEQALVPASLRIGDALNGRQPQEGRLEVLPAGTPPPDPGELVGREIVSNILRRLRTRADILLVDTPPLLQVGDAMTLTDEVDAVLVVIRPNVVRRGVLNEFGRVLASARVDKLGFVLTGAPPDEIVGYGSYYTD
jgi:capsular exopolysaccharide synthesis family protein